ncbi:TIGR02234 family membrane protein [Corynebacterium sp.]|uniref:TIGR02234 family membrane protein n=1 Tax=Corynebacterium sp. TaxID=1720 RepID=UPI002A908AC3|nr:TIGR02234 family membrane protein [Corynebacterium sp.]MDY5785086.1 TIGR02234 family membrane protein [Corynebacterium sp.]
MTDAPDTRRPRSSRLSGLGALLMALGGLVVAGTSRATWMTVQYFDDRAGAGSTVLTGSDWSTEATAVALLLIAAAVAAVALRRLGRRIVGVIAAVAAAAAAFVPARLLVSGADYGRVHALLTAGYDDMQAASGSRSDAIASWAEITGVTVDPLYPSLVLLGFALAAIGGALVALRPGGDAATMNKYEKESVRRAKIEDDLASSPDSGRVMWDAIDADLDPTDPAGPADPTDRHGGAAGGTQPRNI